MRSNCAAEKGRFQFLFFSRQHRRKMFLTREPPFEPGWNTDDDLICAEGADETAMDPRLENGRSRLGWGITHI
jgi:hypothetical protein